MSTNPAPAEPPCKRCGRKSFEYPFCRRRDDDCAAKAADAIHGTALLTEKCPTCKLVWPVGHNCHYAWSGQPCWTRRKATRIITVTEPGYEIALFFNTDGGAEAVISRLGDKPPIVVNIAPPQPGRRIVVERKGDKFEILYREIAP